MHGSARDRPRTDGGKDSPDFVKIDAILKANLLALQNRRGG
jgi:hypothetical protein